MEKSILDLCIKAQPKTPISDNYKKSYGWNNGVVAFYTEEGEYYITPFCHDVAKYLEEIGYKNRNLMVIYEYSWPYKNGDGPIVEGYEVGETVYLGGPTDKETAKKWYDLCQSATEKYNEKQHQQQ